MKFLHYAALVLGATAIRLEADQVSPLAAAPQEAAYLMIREHMMAEDDGPTEKEVEHLVETIMNDLKDNGPMEKERFYDILKGWMKDYAIPPPDAKKGWMRRLFKALDADKNGELTLEEFEAAVKAAG